MHIDATNPPDKNQVISNMQRFKAIGLNTYITEFDVNVSKVKGNQDYKDSIEAQITYNMVRACIESKSCVSFNEFGITDKNNLIKSIFNTNSHSYLFNSRYRPNKSFYSFRNAWSME
jgi:endo-1,4-beta-xylanase